MAQVISDPATTQRLREAVKTVKLVDNEGNVLGHFVPKTLRIPESGRSLREILDDLEKLE
jgi:hypothetical protein